MIYIYCKRDIYILYELYINLLIEKYNIINKVIIDNEEGIIEYIEKNNLKYLNHILITNLNENIILKFNNYDINLYILNTCILNTSENNNLSYLSKIRSNIKILEYNFIQYNYFNENLKDIKNIIYFPILFNNNKLNLNKLYDVAIFNIDNDYKKSIIKSLKDNNINVNNISLCKKNIYNILLKHKIFINFNDDNNILSNEFICNYCINNSIVVINNINSIFNNNFLNKNIYNIDYSHDNIIKNIKYILNNNSNSNNSNDSNSNDNKVELDFNLDNSINDKVINQILENNNMGFIITRNINSELSNNYWVESYKCIRKYYNNKIIIIDDNSNYDYVKNEIELINCTIINSEFKKSGEILPYYYLYKYRFFNKAVILHDSVFINKYINFEEYNNVKFIWHFTHDWDNEKDELELLSKLNNNDLIDFYHNKDKWYGCYGVQSLIEYNFLDILVKKYDIFSLIPHINERELRKNFERIFGLICMYENNISSECSMYGIIHHYIHWGYIYDSYIVDKNEGKLQHLDIIKVWSGR